MTVAKKDAAKTPPTVGATERLSRLLALVPFLVSHQGIELTSAAADLGITEDQLVKDLELLFVCGTPGHLPDDLIEAEWESGRVYLGNADALARPLRLGVDEAVALLVALRTLADVPGVHDRDALERATLKLAAAAGESSRPADAVTVLMEPATRTDALATLRQALATHRRVHLTYLVPSRDETTERDVDPMRLASVDGHWYLEGWCHRAGGVRLFRLDRVEAAELLDVDGTPPPDAVARDLDDGVFAPGADDLRVVLDLQRGAWWIAEYYPCESATDPVDGVRRVELRTADLGWLRRLLLRTGGQAVVVEPAELADQVRRAAEAGVARHSP